MKNSFEHSKHNIITQQTGISTQKDLILNKKAQFD